MAWSTCCGKPSGIRLHPNRTTASFQGFGTVARHAIELYQKIGGTVRAVATWDQGAGEAVTFRREAGVDLDELLGCYDRSGGIHRDRAAEKGYEILAGDAWLEQDGTSWSPRPWKTRSMGRGQNESVSGCECWWRGPTVRPPRKRKGSFGARGVRHPRCVGQCRRRDVQLFRRGPGQPIRPGGRPRCCRTWTTS